MSTRNLNSVPGIENTSEAFRARVIEIADELGTDPNYLMAIMSFETGGSFSPTQKNQAGSGATGLIQFIPETAQDLLGTRTGDEAIRRLEAMTAEEQLEVVRQYFLPYRGQLNNIEDTYMAVLYPVAVGRSNDYVLFEAGTIEYRQNSGLDGNGDGRVTKAEAATPVREFLGGRGQVEVGGGSSGILALGDYGDAVARLQESLQRLGYPVTVDGDFGPGTEAALIRFQQSQGLTPDGLAGPATLQALDAALGRGNSSSILQYGDSGDGVARLQESLQRLGYPVTVDGDFGVGTEDAVMRFQRSRGLTPDGVVGPETQRAINEALGRQSSAPSSEQPVATVVSREDAQRTAANAAYIVTTAGNQTAPGRYELTAAGYQTNLQLGSEGTAQQLLIASLATGEPLLSFDGQDLSYANLSRDDVSNFDGMANLANQMQAENAPREQSEPELSAVG